MTVIRPMTPEDLTLGLRLNRDAGWNQTRADWARFYELQPDGCFVAESDAMAVATVTTCLFGPVAWVAMVLVDRAFRGRGIGRALMTHALEFLDGRGVRTVRLDATAEGRPLYERLGFAGDYGLARFEGTPRVVGASAPAASFDPASMAGIADLDRAVTGTRRDRLLSRLASDHPDCVRIVGEVDGYVMGRPGSHASQVGPCIARGRAGGALLAGALSCQDRRPVFVDIPDVNEAASALASARGLLPGRRFLRMSRGEKVAEKPTEIWASFGPEMG